MTPCSVACQAPLSMDFLRQEYRSELPFPSPGDLPNAQIEPTSHWQADFFFFFYHCGYKGKIILVNCVASDSAGGNALRIVGSTDMEQPWPRIALRR